MARAKKRLTGLPDISLILWGSALDILHYSAPDTDLPFKGIIPGGYTPTMLMLVTTAALSLYATKP